MMFRMRISGVRGLATAGHNRKKRFERKMLEVKRNLPPRLPARLHKDPPNRVARQVLRALGDKEFVQTIKERAELLHTLLMMPSPKEYRPLAKVLAAYHREPLQLRQEEVKMLLDAPTLEGIRAMALESHNLVVSGGGGSPVAQTTTAVVEAPMPTTSQYPALGLPDAGAVETVQDLLIRSVMVQQALASRSSRDVEGALLRMDQTVLGPSSDLGLLLVRALVREHDIKRAHDVFFDFQARRGLASTKLVEEGIKILSILGKPEVAVNMYNYACRKFEHTNARTVLYHPVMRACSRSAKTADQTFEYYLKMVKVDKLVPTRETLALTLRACATLGDVDKAHYFWVQMVENGSVVPDSGSCEVMLCVYANSNRFLRRRLLRADHVLPATFEDMGVLADAAGWKPVDLDRTDEVSLAIEELNKFEQGGFSFEKPTEEEKWSGVLSERSRSLPMFSPDEIGEGEQDGDEEGEDEDEDEDADADAEDDEEFDELGEEEDGGDDSDQDPPSRRGGAKASTRTNALVERRQALSHEIRTRKLEPNAAALLRADAESKLTMRELDEIPQRKQYPILQHGLAQNENIENAEAFFREVTVKYAVKPTTGTLNCLLKVYSDALRLDRAERTLHEVFPMYDVVPNAYTYLLLVRMFVRTRRTDRAMHYFSQAAKSDMLLHETIGEMINGLAFVRMYDEALELVREFKHLRLDERFLQLLRTKLVEYGDDRVSELPPDPFAWRNRDYLNYEKRNAQESPQVRKEMQLIRDLTTNV